MKIAETFEEEFRHREWQSEQLRALAAGEPVPPAKHWRRRAQQPSQPAELPAGRSSEPKPRPYWLYDGEDDAATS